MLCDDVKNLLSQQLDNRLSDEARRGCEAHLTTCPVCRADSAELRQLRFELRNLPQPQVPTALAASISHALAIEAYARQRTTQRSSSAKIWAWLTPRFMPYAISSVASLLLFAIAFGALWSSIRAFRQFDYIARQHNLLANTQQFLDTPDGRITFDINQPVTSEMLAAARSPFNSESPTLNPNGALAELARQLPQSKDNDDDLVVVTDIFANGQASLAGIVQPPRDRKLLNQLETALRRDAAFVPASFDRRPETMRVVFVLQRVQVRDF